MYPLASSGATQPCAVITGPNTLLGGNGNGYGSVVMSAHGRPHATSFQSNQFGAVTVFDAEANGDAKPLRALSAAQDHIAIAVDSHGNDYVIAGQDYAGQQCWSVIPDAANEPNRSNCDPNLTAIYSIAATPRDELVVAGTEISTGNARLDVYANAAGSSPKLVRSIAGSATGLPSISGSNDYFAISLSVAVNQNGGNIYLYDANTAGNPPPHVFVFAGNANGNVAPLRVLAGPQTNLPSAAFALNVLSLDDGGDLFVSSPAGIEIFGAGAGGNATPIATIVDPGVASGTVGGIAVRTHT